MKKSCLKILSTILFFSCISLSIKDLNAGIYFISKENTIQAQNSIKPCQLAGYTKTDAECKKLGLELSDTCSTDTRYGKSCSCDESKFPYTTSNCATPKTPSGDTCNGKYKTCDCAPSVYKYYTNADCPTNEIIDSKTSCTYADGKVGYSTCVCPSQYAETCIGNLEGVGTMCGYGKYVSCRCKSNFIDCGGQKGAVGASSCTDSSGTKYTNCQASSCEDGGFLTSIPTSGHTCTPQTYEGKTCYKNCYRMITPVSFKVSGNGNVILNYAVKGQISGVNEQTIIGGNYTDKTILVHRTEILKFSWAGATNYKLLRWELYRADAQQTTTIGTTNSVQFTIPLTYPTMQITAITEKLLSCEDGGFVSISSIPEGQNCSPVTYSGLVCYKDCKSSCSIYNACPYTIPSANVYNSCVSCGFTPGNFTQTTCDGITYGKCEGCPPGFTDCTIPMAGSSVDSNKCEVKAGGSPEKKCVRIANGQTSCSPCNYCKLSGSSCN